MALRKSLIVLFCFALALILPTFAQASAPPDVYCEEALGGTWAGEDGWNGTCTIPDENSFSDEYCDDGYDLVIYYDEGSEEGSECVPVGTGPGAGGEEYSHNSTQGGDAPVGLCTIAGGPWRCTYFPPETCGQNCYIDPHLPAGANSSLPAGAIATMYVHVVDENGEPGTGSYTVCFENPDGETLTIYRFIGGSWVAVAIGSGNPICTVQSGDGSYYLGH
jgi:hypothetical protein